MCWLNQAEWKALDATDPRPAREKRDGEAIETNIWLRGERQGKEKETGRQEQMWWEIESPIKRYKEEEDKKWWRIGGQRRSINETRLWDVRHERPFIQAICKNSHTAQQGSSPRFSSAADTRLWMHPPHPHRAIILTTNGKIHKFESGNPRRQGSDQHVNVL